MKANELRLGNLVNCRTPFGTDVICRVTSINESGISGVEYTSETSEATTYHMKFEEQPEGSRFGVASDIPITDKWIEKFGFDKGAYDGVCIYFHKEVSPNSYKEDFCIRYYTAGYFNFCREPEHNSAYKTHRSVHSLQNLFSGLISEELIIK